MSLEDEIIPDMFQPLRVIIYSSSSSVGVWPEEYVIRLAEFVDNFIGQTTDDFFGSITRCKKTIECVKHLGRCATRKTISLHQHHRKIVVPRGSKGGNATCRTGTYDKNVSFCK